MAVRIEKPAFNFRDKLNENSQKTVGYDNLPPGTVIQHRYNTASSGGHLTTSSNSWTALGFTVEIVPRYAGSLMLIEYTGLAQQPNTHHSLSCATIYRDGTTNLGYADFGLNAVGDVNSNGGVYVTTPINFFVYDIAAVVGVRISYGLYGKTHNSGTAYPVHGGVRRTLSVKEIKQ